MTRQRHQATRFSPSRNNLGQATAGGKPSGKPKPRQVAKRVDPVPKKRRKGKAAKPAPASSSKKPRTASHMDALIACKQVPVQVPV